MTSRDPGASWSGARHLRVVRGGAEPVARTARRPSLDDTEILAALRAGDETAAAAFHDRVRPQVDRTIVRLLGRQESDREDLAQLALIELVGSIGRFRGDCSLDAWISTVTAHIVYKHIRRRKLERRIFSGIAPEDLPLASHTNVSRDSELANLLLRIRGHLEGIDGDKAWTFLLHDVCGYDLREIAQIMDVSVAAAQRLLVRGRHELHVRSAARPDLADSPEEPGGQ